MTLPNYLPRSHLVSEKELPAFEVASNFSFLPVWEKYKIDKGGVESTYFLDRLYLRHCLKI